MLLQSQHIPVHHMHAWCPPRPVECIGSLGTRVSEWCEWELTQVLGKNIQNF